jgi:hypothetical protein
LSQKKEREMETTTNLSIKAFESIEAETLYTELRGDGYSLMVSKKDYADIISCSLSSVDNYIRDGYGCPNYKKLGKAKNSKVLFSLIDVANYLAQTVRTA